MSDQFLGEIRMFAGNFAPYQWAFCNGQLLPISQYSALFSLFGTYYGGNGQTTFGLPNLQGCVPLDQGQGPGLSLYTIGETGGTPHVILTGPQLAAHGHPFMANSQTVASAANPAGNIPGRGGGRHTDLFGAASPPTNVAMAPGAVGMAGGNQPHENRQPFLALSFIVALQGVYPARQ